MKPSPPSTLTVVVNTIPITPLPSNDAPFCVGNTLNLSASAVTGATYSWKGPNGFTSKQQNPVIANTVVANAGDYSLTINVNGCNSASVVTNVIIYPIPVTTAGSNSPACIGLSIKLTATTFAGATYSWSGSNGFTSNLQNPVINDVTTLDAGTYTVIASANGCVSSPSNTVVVVNPIPAPPVLSNNAPMCSGETLNLKAVDVTGGSFHWTGPNGFNSNLQNPVIVNVPFANGGIYNSIVTVKGCTSPPATTNAVINLSPPATPINNGSLCVGQTLNLSTTPVAGTTYSWIGPHGFISTQQNPTINAVSLDDSGSYSLTMTLNGCVGKTASTKVLIYPIPAPPVLSSNSPICAAQTLQLNAGNVTGGTFAWNGPNSFTSALQNPKIVNAATSSSGDYSATVTVHGCKSPPSVVSTIVKPVPAPPGALTNAPLCEGQTLNLNAGNVAGGTFVWSGPISFTSILQNPSIINAATNNSGTYSVTTIVNGCSSAPSTTDATIYPIPSSSFVIDSPVCDGYKTIATYKGTSLVSATYDWNFGVGQADSSSGQGPHEVSWAGPASYPVGLTVTENGCTSPTTRHTALVFPVPTPDFNLPSPICESDSELITYTGTGSASGIYDWNFGGGMILSGSGKGPYRIKFPSVDTFMVSLVVTENGCPSLVDSQNIIVNFVPTADFAVTPSVICPNQDAMVTYTGTGTTAAIFQWNFGRGTGGDNTIGPHRIHFINPGLETLTLTVTENNCPSSPVTQVLLVDSLPPVIFHVNDLGCDPFPATFVNNTRKAVSYLWKFGDGDTSTVKNPVHTYSPGVFTVGLVATNLTGCIDSVIKPQLIKVLNNPEANFSFIPFVNVPLEVKNASYTFFNHSKYADSYKWDFGDGYSSDLASPEHHYTDSGDFKVMMIAYNDIGCTDTFTSENIAVILNVNYFIPNTFTPNNDGINDYFHVYGRSLSSVHLSVFDRTGEKVFETEDMYKGWDGTFKGVPMNNNVFVYYAVMETLTGKRIIVKGDVTLLK